MGIIKYFRKKYWEAAIFGGGRRIPFSCDGLTAVPDRAYALFTEKELEKIYNDSSNYIVSNTKDRKGKSFRDKTLNYLKDIGNSSVKNEIEAHLSKNKTVLFTDGVTWYFFEKNEKALEENKAEMFELGIRIIDEKKFDHIKWNESEKRYNDLKEKIKALCES